MDLIEKEENMVDSWIETSFLDDNNSLENIVEKGFEFTSSGLVFPTGHITLTNQDKSGTQELLLARIAVGKPLCVKANEGGPINDKRFLPPGFDSVYLVQDPTYKPFHDDAYFKHDYVLYENHQVNIMKINNKW